MTSQKRPTHPNSQPTDATPCDSAVACCPDIIQRENVIFIGSEMLYDSFWLKMMFIAAAYAKGSRGRGLRPANKNTVAYVDEGYTRHEKLTLDLLRSSLGFDIIKIDDSSDIVNHLNTRPETSEGGRKVKLLLQDVAFFSHGVPGAINLNYAGDYDVNFTETQLRSIQKSVFVPDGRIYSYACRTGVSSMKSSFTSDADAGMKSSLAQKMASHFKVEVHAFLRRSSYGSVLKDAKDSASIAATLKEARETQQGQVIPLPPDHEALPHPGLGGDSWREFFTGSKKKEGTLDYALWRKAGGIRLPTSGDSPSGLSAGIHVFTPQ